MEKNKKNKLKDHFDQSEKTPPSSLWAGIESQLPSRNAGTPLSVTGRWALGVALVLMLTLATYAYLGKGGTNRGNSGQVSDLESSSQQADQSAVQSAETAASIGQIPDPGFGKNAQGSAQPSTQAATQAPGQAAGQAAAPVAASESVNPATDLEPSHQNIVKAALNPAMDLEPSTQQAVQSAEIAASVGQIPDPGFGKNAQGSAQSSTQAAGKAAGQAAASESGGPANDLEPSHQNIVKAALNPAMDLEPSTQAPVQTAVQSAVQSAEIAIPNDCPDFNKSRRPLFYWEVGLGTGTAQRHLESLVFPDGGYPQLRKETETIKPNFSAQFQVGMLYKQFTLDLGLEFFQHRALFQGSKDNEIRITISNVFDTNGQLLRTDTLVEAGSREIQSNLLWRHYQIPIRMGYLKRTQNWSYGAQLGLQWNFLTTRTGIIFDPNREFYSLEEDPQGYFKNSSHLRAQINLYLAKRMFHQAEVFLRPQISQDLQVLTTESSPFEERYRHLQCFVGFRKYF